MRGGDALIHLSHLDSLMRTLLTQYDSDSGTVLQMSIFHFECVASWASVLFVRLRSLEGTN